VENKLPGGLAEAASARYAALQHNRNPPSETPPMGRQ